MNNFIITDFKGENPISSRLLKQIILGEDFLTSWWAVCVYIFKMDLQPFHLKIMKHQIDNKNSLFMGGRGLGKSYVCNSAYVVTLLLRDNNITIACITASLAQSKAFVSEVKALFEEGTIIYQLFGNLKGDKWKETEFTLKRKSIKKECSLTACSMTASGNLISRHFDLLILDDLVSQDNSQTALQRNKLKSYLYNVVFPTLENQSKYAGIKCVGTHYNVADLWVDFKEGNMFHSLCLPTLLKDKKDNYKSIWEWKKPVKELLELKKEIGSIAFNMQYQARVIKGTGGIFKRENIQFFNKYTKDYKDNVKVYYNAEDIEELQVEEVDIYMGIDTAISQKKTADRFVVGVIGIGKDTNNIYLLDMYANRVSYSKQVGIIEKYANKWNPLRIGIEKVGQSTLFQEVKEKTELPVTALKTKVDKVTRMNIFSAKWESNQIYMYQKIDCLELLLTEALNFPNEQHDDTIDCFCMCYETYKTAKNSGITVDNNPFRF